MCLLKKIFLWFFYWQKVDYPLELDVYEFCSDELKQKLQAPRQVPFSFHCSALNFHHYCCGVELDTQFVCEDAERCRKCKIWIESTGES